MRFTCNGLVHSGRQRGRETLSDLVRWRFCSVQPLASQKPKSHTKWLWDLCFSSPFLRKEMAENTTCEIKNMPQTPTGRRGRILFAQPGGIICLALFSAGETLSFLQSPAKILNGNKRSIEMEVNLLKCAQLDQKC